MSDEFEKEIAESTEAIRLKPNDADAYNIKKSSVFMPFCTNCGNEVKDGMKFCGSCGAAAGGVARSAPDDADIPQRRTAGKKNNVVWIVVWIAAGFVGFILSATVMPRNTFTDKRDKMTYRTVKIGKQTWMAE